MTGDGRRWCAVNHLHKYYFELFPYDLIYNYTPLDKRLLKYVSASEPEQSQRTLILSCHIEPAKSTTNNQHAEEGETEVGKKTNSKSVRVIFVLN